MLYKEKVNKKFKVFYLKKRDYMIKICCCGVEFENVIY